MERIIEPELMDDPAQARAYAAADFDAPHSALIDHLSTCFPGFEPTGPVLDLGCGPADITVRLARLYPRAPIHGLDGAPAMLDEARRRIADEELQARITLYEGRLPEVRLPVDRYALVASNSLLHHLHEPAVLWDSVTRYAAPAAPVFIADLMRPESESRRQALAERYSADAPEILRRDFRHSLAAAFRVDEVRAQLDSAGLHHFDVRAVSDRHLIAWGRR